MPSIYCLRGLIISHIPGKWAYWYPLLGKLNDYNKDGS